ncbi:hypothetical protein [Parafrankia discariae]|uniref:hypothetical protein n=1 Tax=Parafrankia discariae TaxID=365528 RepID=UPI00036ED8F5|nr:hypothetical protein [Parafrankia discariae]
MKLPPGLVTAGANSRYSVQGGQHRHTRGGEAAAATAQDWDGQVAVLRRMPMPSAPSMAAGVCGSCEGPVELAGYCRCSA